MSFGDGPAGRAIPLPQQTRPYRGRSPQQPAPPVHCAPPPRPRSGGQPGRRWTSQEFPSAPGPDPVVHSDHLGKPLERIALKTEQAATYGIPHHAGINKSARMHSIGIRLLQRGVFSVISATLLGIPAGTSSPGQGGGAATGRCWFPASDYRPPPGSSLTRRLAVDLCCRDMAPGRMVARKTRNNRFLRRCACHPQTSFDCCVPAPGGPDSDDPRPGGQSPARCSA